MSLLKSILLPVIEALFKLLFGRKSQPPEVSRETYAAKAAEARELAKPDASQSDVVNRL
jgi:hypothetical protein